MVLAVVCFIPGAILLIASFSLFQQSRNRRCGNARFGTAFPALWRLQD